MKAKELGIPITLHAGEWPDEEFNSISNVEFALNEAGVRRLGHGIALGKHPRVRRIAKEKNVAIEVR